MTADARDDQIAYQRLVRQARLLAAGERDAGIVEIWGTPVPPAPPAATDARAATPAAPATPRTAPALPSSDDFIPRVRPLDLRSDVLAPFGDLPARVAACTLCVL